MFHTLISRQRSYDFNYRICLSPLIAHCFGTINVTCNPDLHNLDLRTELAFPTSEILTKFYTFFDSGLRFQLLLQIMAQQMVIHSAFNKSNTIADFVKESVDEMKIARYLPFI